MRSEQQVAPGTQRLPAATSRQTHSPMYSHWTFDWLLQRNNEKALLEKSVSKHWCFWKMLYRNTNEENWGSTSDRTLWITTATEPLKSQETNPWVQLPLVLMLVIDGKGKRGRMCSSSFLSAAWQRKHTNIKKWIKSSMLRISQFIFKPIIANYLVSPIPYWS